MTDRKKRDPLPAGDRRRLTDARCAWRKMTPKQREEFLRWIMPLGLHVVLSGSILERAERLYP